MKKLLLGLLLFAAVAGAAFGRPQGGQPAPQPKAEEELPPPSTNITATAQPSRAQVTQPVDDAPMVHARPPIVMRDFIPLNFEEFEPDWAIEPPEVGKKPKTEWFRVHFGYVELEEAPPPGVQAFLLEKLPVDVTERATMYSIATIAGVRHQYSSFMHLKSDPSGNPLQIEDENGRGLPRHVQVGVRFFSLIKKVRPREVEMAVYWYQTDHLRWIDDPLKPGVMMPNMSISTYREVIGVPISRWLLIPIGFREETLSTGKIRPYFSFLVLSARRIEDTVLPQEKD